MSLASKHSALKNESRRADRAKRNPPSRNTRPCASDFGLRPLSDLRIRQATVATVRLGPGWLRSKEVASGRVTSVQPYGRNRVIRPDFAGSCVRSLFGILCRGGTIAPNGVKTCYLHGFCAKHTQRFRLPATLIAEGSRPTQITTRCAAIVAVSRTLPSRFHDVILASISRAS